MAKIAEQAERYDGKFRVLYYWEDTDIFCL
jgi:hypothetical protein